MSESFYHNSVYAFSENRVTDGVEIEGLEYLDADEARVTVTMGTAFIKLNNFSSVFQRTYRESHAGASLVYRNPDGTGRGTGEVGRVLIPQNPQAPNVALTERAKEKEIKKNRSQRRKEARDVEKGNVPIRVGASKAAFGAVLVVNIVTNSIELYNDLAVSKDRDMLSSQTLFKTIHTWGGSKTYVPPLAMAVADVFYAISEEMVDKEFLNIDDVSSLINIVLYGGEGTESEELRNTGLRIIREVSERRVNQYDENGNN